MLTLEIGGHGTWRIEHLVVDLNGTLAIDGDVSPSVAEALDRLSDDVRIVMLTADTRGTAQALGQELGIDVHVIDSPDEAAGKLDFVNAVGAASVVAIGNGANDSLSLGAAAIGICVMGREGAASSAVYSSDAVVGSMEDALGLLLEPQRLVATLRR